MKTRSILTIAFLLTARVLMAQTSLPIDIKSSTVNWTGHAEIGTYAPAGTLNYKQGQLLLKNETVVGATITIDMKSMQQANANLVDHLKSEDFFDVEKFPESTIKINKVANGTAYGQLTIKNTTQPFSCPVTIKKTEGKLTLTGNTVIDRTKYGIVYNSGSFFSGLGDKAIRNTFDVTFSVAASL